MYRNRRSFLELIYPIIVFFVCSRLGVVVNAQIVPDSTLGNESSIVTPIDSTTEQIDGGAIRGVNLFHSFQQFSIPEGRTANFTNPERVQTIFSRVTGQKPSRLFGTLGVLGNANLFFINPNGIIFGPNSQINVVGSFVASTAHSITFPDGSRFGATNPDSPALLTVDVAVPVGLQFEGDRSGTIVNLGNITSGGNIALVGGTVVNTGQILSPGGTTSILTGADGVINLDLSGKVISQTNLGITLDAYLVDFVKQEGEFSGLTVNENSQVQVISSRTSVEAGDIVVEGAIAGGEAIDLSSAKDLKLVNGLLQIVLPEGDIRLTATGDISIEGSAVLSSLQDIRGNTIFEGNSGDIVLRSGGNITGANSTILSLGLLSGDIRVDSQGDISLTLTDILSSNLSQLSTETGGDVAINAKNLVMSDAGIGTLTDGTVNAGNVTVKVQDSVLKTYTGDPRVTRFSGTLGSGSALSASGNLGDVTVETQKLSVTNGATILATSVSTGKAGDVTIKAQSIELTGIGITPTGELFGSSIATGTFPDEAGSGGELIIETESLLVADGGQIQTPTRGVGNAGNITITAKTIELLGIPLNEDGSQPEVFGLTVIVSAVAAEASGNGGKITITTDSLRITNGAQILSATLGIGNAGRIEITTKSMEITGTGVEASGLFASTARNSRGNGGNIEILADRLQITNGAAISAETGGAGKAGNILITTEKLRNQNGGFISTTVGETSTTLEQGGNITINASQVNLLDRSGLLAQTRSIASGGTIVLQPRDGSLVVDIQGGSQLSATSLGTGIAGDIFINNAQSLSLNQGSIVAQTVSSTGGNITLTIDNLLTLANNSQISTTAGTAQAGGDGGNITIMAGFIIANPNENSDITANAFTGRGGNINITTDGIFGLQERDFPTLLSDITASSQFGLDGTIILNTTGVDPTRGLVTLTEATVNPEISQGCQVNSNTNAAFYNLGRGGLPSRPEELFIDPSVGVLMPWVEEEIENPSDRSPNEGNIKNLIILPCQS